MVYAKFASVLLFCIPVICFSQKHDNIWIIGYGGGAQSPPNDEFGNMILDFSTIDTPIITEAQQYDMNFNLLNTIICDSTGSLLFYSNGETVYNQQHKIMANGSNLVSNGTGLGYHTIQGGLILPQSWNKNLYYLFIVEDHPSAAYGWKLFQNTVDISLNSGLGRVIEKRTLIVDDSLTFGLLTAVKHANGRDWWFYIRKLNTNIWYRGLLSPSGIQVDTISEGSAFKYGGGQVTFSPDGRFYIVADDESSSKPAAIHIYDFDRCTGTFSNQRTHYVDSNPNFGVGVAVSPDSRYLYVFHTTVGYQYDLKATNIFESEVLIGQYDGFISGLYGSYFLFAQTAPDGRIYVGSWAGTFHWHTIQFPNRQSIDCDFEQHSIEFPVYLLEGLPNSPNFRLGPIDGSLCDTLGLDNHPLANFRWEQEDSTELLRITFTDLSAYEPETWHWTFGDGSESQDTSPVHTYAQPDVYEVCLVVSNQNSADTICRTVNVGVSSTNDDQAAPFEVVAYPNPFSDRLILQLKGLDYLRGEVDLFDVAGQLVSTTMWHGRQLDWYLGHLTPGIYFFRVMTDRGVLKTGKIIKL